MTAGSLAFAGRENDIDNVTGTFTVSEKVKKTRDFSPALCCGETDDSAEVPETVDENIATTEDDDGDEATIDLVLETPAAVV